ncbi:hypothetical protein PAXINDRAFT_20416 [Paxillus involutus ATCC 200175]|uniref:Uncharacterized protein n=1 Tax=Paxillus involutus ATCC 200175 TaxID=664439 RepID=A0A0C9T4T7_PAXIN|nr:hypothetical protein PAXINDRAFT_20416 [Paxillus involutus ATCC 200175]
MAEIPTLRMDGQNWPTWCANLEEALNELGISASISQTMPNPYNKQVNALAKCTIASTIPDALLNTPDGQQSGHWHLEPKRKRRRDDDASGHVERTVESLQVKQQ